MNKLEYNRLKLCNEIMGIDLMLRTQGDVIWIDLPDDIDIIIGDQRYNNKSGVVIRLGKPKKKN